MKKPTLPIDALLPEILAALRSSPNLVLEAAPGAGKTTRVPPALLELVSGEVLVVEPRRIAARMAARRVAAELGEEVGETVGYQVRFEEKSGPQTRLRYVTEGILTRRMTSDPDLKGVDAVVLDEFHERHLETDLALALLKRLQSKRQDLRIVVMSATLEASPVAAYLGGCKTLCSEGRQFPLTVRHLPYSPRPLAEQVRSAVELLEGEGHTGNTLVFVPGAAEIRQTLRECEAITQRSGVTALPLHSDLTAAEQDRAVLPSAQRKLIVATNVAESSVTVAGVTAVIDSGLARVATHSPWTGLPTLQIARISKASAKQRAGRAGRIAAGTALRLYPQEDYALRHEHETPEILRADLTQLLLSLRAMGIRNAAELDWLDAPAEAALSHAAALLDRLGADGVGAQQMSRLPLPPRLARMVLEAVERGVGEMGCRVAALLSGGARLKDPDLLEALDEPMDDRTRQLMDQLVRIVRPARQAKQDEEALLLAVLAGFGDRVGRRRVGKQVQLANGVMAEVMGETAPYEFMVAVDAEDRQENALPRIRLTARVEPEWLLELFPSAIAERSFVEWSRSGERVDRVSSLMYDELPLEETRRPALDEEGAALLARKALETGIEAFVDAEALALLLARLTFAGAGDVDVESVVRELCVGLTSFAQLGEAARSLIPLLEARAGVSRLQELAPTMLRLAGGRSVKVHYEEGRTPWIASRLQDFFGMKETPRLGPEHLPVVVHLLAPNQRAVQTTTDLAGFWERLYPEVRRELMRRYPRHQWPEKP